MSSADESASLTAQVRTQQIIVAALVLGLVMFLVIAAYLRATGQFQGVPAFPILTYVAIPLGLGVLAAYAVVPNLVAASGRRRIADGTWNPVSNEYGSPVSAPASDRGKLLQVYGVRLIIGVALWEAVAFFLIIAYLVEGSPWLLAGAIICAAVLAAHFPTRGRVEQWLENQKMLLDNDRMTLRMR
jgi:hypothetical protein